MAEPGSDRERRALFVSAVLPHLDTAYNLARWLTRDARDAEDLVQESVLRALTYFDGFRVGDGRAWLLAIVRNAFYTSIKRNGAAGRHEPLADDLPEAIDPAEGEAVLERRVEVAELGAAIADLPPPFREVVVLRDIEGLSYKEIAGVAGMPIGTVMSRLARARGLLKRRLTGGRKARA